MAQRVSRRLAPGATEREEQRLHAIERTVGEDRPHIIRRMRSFRRSELVCVAKECSFGATNFVGREIQRWIECADDGVDQREDLGAVTLGNADDVGDDMHRELRCDLRDEVDLASPLGRFKETGAAFTDALFQTRDHAGRERSGDEPPHACVLRGVEREHGLATVGGREGCKCLAFAAPRKSPNRGSPAGSRGGSRSPRTRCPLRPAPPPRGVGTPSRVDGARRRGRAESRRDTAPRRSGRGPAREAILGSGRHAASASAVRRLRPQLPRVGTTYTQRHACTLRRSATLVVQGIRRHGLCPVPATARRPLKERDTT